MSSIRGYTENWILKAEKHFSEWDKNFYLWKSFKCEQRNLIRAFIGLTLFGNPCKNDDSDLCDIYFKYSKVKRKLITELEDKFKFECGRVVIGLTYLYIDNGNICCVFRQMKSNQQIIFIDCVGRVYQSWGDFCENNQLPNCKYIAPEDGLHKTVRQRLFIYLSPAGSLGSKVLKVADAVATGCALGALGLILLPVVAPVTGMILGAIGSVHCAGRGIGNLKDRWSHEQSIALDNAESILSWTTVVTPVISGLSTAALSNSFVIVEASGSYANIAKALLKGLNYAALTSSFCNFGTYVYVLRKKIRSGEELTMFDYMEGCVNLFLIAGAVSSTRQMHKFINSLEATPATTTGRLTRTAKRKLQRSRAKSRKEGTLASGNAQVKEVTTLEENVPNWSLHILLTAGQRFLVGHIDIQNIYYKCLEIWDTCCDFRCNKIGAVVFVSNMINHIQNLFNIIADTMQSLKTKIEPFLSSYFSHGAPSSLTEQIGHMFENTTSAMKEQDERLFEDENEQPAENEPKLKYKIIFEIVKNRIPRTTQSHEIIFAFGEQLSILIDEITIELNNNYETWVSRNIEMLGKDEANELFSKLGLKTLNDFANFNFVRIIESKNCDIATNHIMANEEIIQKMWTFYDSLLSKVTPRSTLAELGTMETFQLLKKSLIEFFNPIDKKFKSAKELYDINASFVGHVTAMNLVLETLKVDSNRSYSSDNSTFFDLVVETLPVDRIIQELSFAISCKKQTNKISSQLRDENVQCTLLSLCDTFFRQVEPKLNITDNGEREKRVKDCYQYFLDNFADFIQKTNKAQSAKTLKYFELGSALFNRQMFVNSFRNACVAINNETFASAVEHFTQEMNIEALAEKYIATHKVASNFYVKVCNDINNEDGMRIFSINEGGYLNLRAYKVNAAKLFDLNENEMELVKWENGAVILKCGLDKNIIFQTVDTKSMIAMEIDTSKEPDSK